MVGNFLYVCFSACISADALGCHGIAQLAEKLFPGTGKPVSRLGKTGTDRYLIHTIGFQGKGCRHFLHTIGKGIIWMKFIKYQDLPDNMAHGIICIDSGSLHARPLAGELSKSIVFTDLLQNFSLPGGRFNA